MAKFSVTLLLLVGAAFASAVDYCSISTCGSLKHTLCTYTTTTVASACGTVSQTGLTTAEKASVLAKHNALRAYVAAGSETQGNPGPQPAATNMATLTWDDELATIAQRWANQCSFAHDKCRDVERFQVGQNLAYRGTTASVSTIAVADLVQDWYDEVADYNSSEVASFTRLYADNGNQIGHYTQLVWAETTKVGCGGMKYKSGSFNRFYLVCNYGMAGNWLGEPVYETA